jgi:hypothetical protein
MGACVQSSNYRWEGCWTHHCLSWYRYSINKFKFLFNACCKCHFKKYNIAHVSAGISQDRRTDISKCRSFKNTPTTDTKSSSFVTVFYTVHTLRSEK